MHRIKNLKEAAERIKQAVLNKERIILYGDSDLDGISSVVILEEAIKNLGGQIASVFFPDRENDGYGINRKSLETLKSLAPALFITLDLGIGNFKEVELAKEIGFEVIIVDHHQVLNKVPNALIVVDPRQEGDNYPFKDLANVGITFKLAEELLGDQISSQLRNSFLELTALGTIADMMPQIEDNKEFIEEGLRSLKNTFRPGLRVFLDIFGTGSVFNGYLQKIIAALNAAEGTGERNDAYLLLTCGLAERCRELADGLIAKTAQKRQIVDQIVQEVERRISQKPEEPIIFQGDPAWRLALAGTISSILCQKYQKPAFIFKKMDKESCGSVRNPGGTDSVAAMKTCADFLITYGGHACASGFRVKNEDLDKFEKCLNAYFKK